MKIIKNSHIAKQWGVTPTTVANWIESALKRRNNIELVELKKKYYILDTANNRLIMNQLVEKGRIHKNKNARKIVKADSKIFEIFTLKQISELILFLEKSKEIPHKFTYFNGGANEWESYSIRTFKEKIINTITNSLEAIKNSKDFIFSLIEEGEKVSFFDLGPGDLSPLKNLLKGFNDVSLLESYYAIDISREMLIIAEKNYLKLGLPIELFNKKLIDFTEDQIYDLLFLETAKARRANIKNFIFLAGSTIENQLDPQEVVKKLSTEMGIKDNLFIGHTIDSASSKSYFDIKSASDKMNGKIPLQNRWILDLLGVEEDFYTPELYYDLETKTRKLDIILKSDLLINLEGCGISKEIDLRTGQRVTVYRHSQHSLNDIINLYTSSNLEIKHLTVSKDQSHVFIASGLKSY